MNIPPNIRRYVSGKLRWVAFKKDFRAFAALSSEAEARFPVRWENRLPCLYDKTTATAFDRQYIYHPAWAARVLSVTKPDEHTDISSTLAFCTIISAFIPVKFYDYRPAELYLSGLVSEHVDLTALPFESGSLLSMSCMHTVEHIGLGRYGDPLDPEGDMKAIHELKRVLAPGGTLLFAVPLGKPKLMFNGHRIYSYDQIISYFAGLDLVQFSLILDDSEAEGFVENATRERADAQTYGCGCFWFRKPIE